MTIKRMDSKSFRQVDSAKRKMDGVKGAPFSQKTTKWEIEAPQKLLKEQSNGRTKWINLFRRYQISRTIIGWIR
jgi:hypothetical protein